MIFWVLFYTSWLIINWVTGAKIITDLEGLNIVIENLTLQHVPSNTTELYLGNNPLGEIPGGVFLHFSLPSLTKLKLDDTQLDDHSFTNSSFAGLTTVTEVSLKTTDRA